MLNLLGEALRIGKLRAGQAINTGKLISKCRDGFVPRRDEVVRIDTDVAPGIAAYTGRERNALQAYERKARPGAQIFKRTTSRIDYQSLTLIGSFSTC